jgi:Fur family ferric uptake transcriptional regulator
MKSEYNTKQRQAIFDFLKENTSHVTVADVTEHMKKQGISIGVATVYRTLDKFVKEGLVNKFVIDEHSGACYQIANGKDCTDHFHLKCLKCGKLIHLSCEFLESMEKHIFNDHAFIVSSGKTVIYGICAECSKTSVSQDETCDKHHK